MLKVVLHTVEIFKYNLVQIIFYLENMMFSYQVILVWI